jgi:uncharacterized repeat protein (TIGR03803 family)
MFSSYSISVLADLGSGTGESPQGGLIVDSAGNLYGTAENGGTSNVGTVFEVPKGSTTATALASFNGTIGSNPLGNLTMDSAGDLFGTASVAGEHEVGTLFELAHGSGSISVVAPFGATPTSPTFPLSPIAMDSAGDIFGTAGGGTTNNGTVWEVPAGGGLSTVFNTTQAQGIGSSNELLDSSGDLYVVDSDGGPLDRQFGTEGDGQVYELPAGTRTFTLLHQFDQTDGAAPVGGMVMDSAGDLFGTTGTSGADGGGTVWELPAGGGAFETLASFASQSTGADPNTGLLLDGNGDLFGTTTAGGTDGDGTLWELPSGASSITDLANFNDSTIGGDPAGSLVMDSAGDIYGTCVTGGTADPVEGGTVWEAVASASPTPTPTATLTITAAAAQSAVAGTAQTFDLGSFAETGGTAPYTATINWGDGSTAATETIDAAGTIPAESHTFASAGTDTVSVTVADAAGNVSTAGTFTATVTAVATAPFTLTPTKSSVPTALVAGTKVKGTVTVTIANSSGIAMAKATPEVVSLYATTTGVIDGSSTLLGSARRSLKLAAGKSATLGVAVKPSALPAGTYTILAQMTDATGAVQATAASGASLQVATAFISLSATLPSATPLAVTAGKTALSLTLALTNAGNVNSSGMATLAVYLSADGTTPTFHVTTVRASFTVKPGGKPTPIKLKVKVPASATAGTFFPLVVIDQGDATATAVAASMVNVTA